MKNGKLVAVTSGRQFFLDKCRRWMASTFGSGSKQSVTKGPKQFGREHLPHLPNRLLVSGIFFVGPLPPNRGVETSTNERIEAVPVPTKQIVNGTRGHCFQRIHLCKPRPARISANLLPSWFLFSNSAGCSLPNRVHGF